MDTKSYSFKHRYTKELWQFNYNIFNNLLACL